MFHMGVSNAATVRAGRAVGRGDPVGLAQGSKAAIIVSVIFALLTMAVFFAIPGVLIGVFIDPDEPARAAIIAMGTGLMAMAALFQLADGVQVTVLGLLRGVRDTRAPMWIAALSYWAVGMPVSYGLGVWLGWGGLGIWAGLVTGLAVAAVLLMVRFWRSSLPRACLRMSGTSSRADAAREKRQ
jgi:MATE family multidrug resistance protein